MKCMRCGALLNESAYCPECGCDVSVQKQAIILSGIYYNQGLEKAQIRDLSGAIDQLKRSLKFDKMNIPARNLLGLVYFETGEVVSALSEWVISKNIQPENNMATEYIDDLRKDANRLDMINQTIKKYNLALENSQNGHEDVAEIQLKKILAQNPKLIKGYQLLSLLYMKKGHYEKARKVLKKCARIDRTNTKTLRFLKEVDEQTGTVTSLEPRFSFWGSRDKNVREEPIPEVGGIRTEEKTIIPAADITDHSRAHNILNIVIGIAIGAACVWFLIVPAYLKSINKDMNSSLLTYSSQLATKNEEINRLQNDVESTSEDAESGHASAEDASNLAENRLHLLNALNAVSIKNYDLAAEEADQVKEDLLTDEEMAIYEKVCTDTGATLLALLKEDGMEAFDSADYETAITKLERALTIDGNDYDVLNYLGHAYRLSEDQDKADELFLRIVEAYPDTTQSENAMLYLSDEAKAKAESILETKREEAAKAAEEEAARQAAEEAAAAQAAAEEAARQAAEEEAARQAAEAAAQAQAQAEADQAAEQQEQ